MSISMYICCTTFTYLISVETSITFLVLQKGTTAGFHKEREIKLNLTPRKNGKLPPLPGNCNDI